MFNRVELYSDSRTLARLCVPQPYPSEWISGVKIVKVFHTAFFPFSQASGPRASWPLNSTMRPNCDHSHQMLIDPDEGPLPPPLRLGSPMNRTRSRAVVVGVRLRAAASRVVS